jgi:hypothetical protein
VPAVRRRGVPPVALTRKTECGSPRRVKASQRPSGDHAGTSGRDNYKQNAPAPAVTSQKRERPVGIGLLSQKAAPSQGEEGLGASSNLRH